MVSGPSSLLMTRFRPTKPSNAYWLRRSMEHLTAVGSPLSLAGSAAPLSTAGAANSVAGRIGRHRLDNEPGGSVSTLPSTSAALGDQQQPCVYGDSDDHFTKCKQSNPAPFPFENHTYFHSKHLSVSSNSHGSYSEITENAHCWRASSHAAHH